MENRAFVSGISLQLLQYMKYIVSCTCLAQLLSLFEVSYVVVCLGIPLVTDTLARLWKPGLLWLNMDHMETLRKVWTKWSKYFSCKNRFEPYIHTVFPDHTWAFHVAYQLRHPGKDLQQLKSGWLIYNLTKTSRFQKIIRQATRSYIMGTWIKTKGQMDHQ